MKLRNITTREICDAEMREDGIYIKANWSDEEKWFCYDLEALARSWEYYVEPKGPLIKDERVRKAVRAWASTFGDIRKIAVKYDAVRVSFHFGAVDSSIEFGDDVDIDCEDRQLYTIEELCGEDE